MIEITKMALDGVLEIIPRRIEDGRGYFCETYNRQSLRAAGILVDFVQDNHSFSRERGVLRGLHYQLPPHPQAKLIRVLRGTIFDVAVDIRRSAASFGKWTGVVLSADKGNQLLIPVGFAHGFLTLEPATEVAYKTSDHYAPVSDRAIRFDDPQIGIEWPGDAGAFHLSDKDQAAPRLRDAELFD